MIVNKPADWICTASDVNGKNIGDLSMGVHRLSDFRVDLIEHKPKFIHRWVQLACGPDASQFPTLFDSDQNYGLCHRIDRETSGALIFARTDSARAYVRKCFHNHYIRKLYVCLCHGRIEDNEQVIERSIQEEGTYARLHAGGKRARTNVKVLGHYQ